MGHHSDHEETNLTHEEIMYRYHIQRGHDFIKIELLRSAREQFELALKYKPGDPVALQKAAESDQQIKVDRKKVLVIVPVVLAIIVAVALLA